MEVSFENANDNDMSHTNATDSKMMGQSDEDNTDDEVCQYTLSIHFFFFKLKMATVIQCWRSTGG